MPEFSITGLDIAIVLIYLIGTRIAFGWYAARRARGLGVDGYFLAGRSMRWPLIGLSFYVANMSGSSFIALPGSGYHQGIGVYNYEWLPALILIVFAIFFLPSFLNNRIRTAPEYLERRFGPTPRLLFSAFLLLANIFIDAAAALYAGATLMQVLFPQIPLWLTVAVSSAVAGLYIVAGGLRAVVLNDALQACMILLGGTLLAVLTWQALPSWAALQAQLPPDALHLIRPADDPDMPGPGLLTGVLVIGIYFWCTNQFVIQRALGAADLNQARWGALLAGCLKLPNLFLLVLPGVMAVALYPSLPRPDLVFPTLVFDLLPAGVRGLMLAALAAALLSSLEAILNSTATLFTLDFVQRLAPGLGERALVRSGRLATLGFMVAAAVWAPQIQHFTTLWQYLQSILAYVTPPVVAVFLLGMFWPRASRAGAVAALGIGTPLGVAAWFANEIAGVFTIQYLYACGLMFMLSSLLLVAASLCGRPPEPGQVRDCVWVPALWRAERGALSALPWYADYRSGAAVLLALTGACVYPWL